LGKAEFRKLIKVDNYRDRRITAILFNSIVVVSPKLKRSTSQVFWSPASMRIFLQTDSFSTLPFLAALLVALGISLSSKPTDAQVALPDTPAGNRMTQLLKCVSEPDKKKRDELVTSIFSDEEDPIELCEIATSVHEQSNGMTIHEILRSDPLDILTICAMKTGAFAKIRITVADDDEHKITDVGLWPYDPEKKALKRIGNLIPLTLESGETLPAARGVWLAKGYGYIVEVTEDAIHYYDYTGKFGWKAEAEDDNMEGYFVVDQPNGDARFTFHPKEHGYVLTKLDALPAACIDQSEWMPTRLFDAFADVMTKHYPFFEVRKVDWQARLKQHRPRVNDLMTESELFDVMESMLVNLKDGHTGLRAEIDGKTRSADTGRSKTSARLRKAFAEQSEVKTYRKYRSLFSARLNECITEEVLGGKPTKHCQNRFTWGLADEKIGYLNIAGMSGFGIGDVDDQVAALHKALDEILTSLADTDAIIIDVSMNPGGSDLFSLEIASHFADQKRVGFSKWPAAVKDYRQDRTVTPYKDVNENGVVYLKPIYLVTSDVTGSAAEIFTMSMRAFPNVTTVGMPTSGALSDVLDKTLPNGWSFQTSNEIYVDHEGICYEGKGIPPQVEIKLFAGENLLRVNYHHAIAQVVKMALEPKQSHQ
jgi:carboxyl-terminal processing protease